MGAPKLVSNVNEWGFQDHHIERLMDHSALTAANPENTLVFAGPSRWSSTDDQSIADKLLPLGMMQQVNIGQALGIVPGMAIGSSRKFYLDGPSNNSLSLARLLLNGRNLLRALMTNAMQAGIDPSRLDSPASKYANSAFLINLDSELFKVPFGFGGIFYDKVHNWIGSFYLEHARIQSYGMGWAPGQPMIVENSQIIFDRVIPLGPVVGVTPEHDNPDGLLSSSLADGANGADGLPVDGQLPSDSK